MLCKLKKKRIIKEKKLNQFIEIMQKWSIIKLWRPWDVCLAIDWLEVAIVSHMNIINIKSGSRKNNEKTFISFIKILKKIIGIE